MAKKDEMTSFVFMWECPNGERKWEAIQKGQTGGFLKKLLDDGVHPATVMVAYAPILFHFVWGEYHNNLTDVNFHEINTQIYGTAPQAKTNRKPVDVPVKKKVETKYGWLAPDGRFFHCDYGGHSGLACKIVGDIEYIRNPEKHLEDKGWAKILSGGGTNKAYALCMGLDEKLTDKQLNTLQHMGLDDIADISWFL